MKNVFWVTAEKTKLHEERALALGQHMFEVSWFTDLNTLLEKISVHRAYIIILDEGTIPQKTCAEIAQLTSIGELRGARFILSLRQHNPVVMNQAASSNFRDMIPLDLNEKQWVFRLLFSSAGKSIDYFQPEGQILINKSVRVAFPCRLISLNGLSLRVESQLTPELGTTMHLTGPIAEAIDLRHLEIYVERLEQTHLTFRYSQAFIGTLKIPAEKMMLFNSQTRYWQKSSPAPKKRIFIAAKTPAMRQSLQNFFENGDYLVNAALQLKSLTTEPQYFSPDFIFIEKLLCLGEHQSRFEQMLSNVPSSCAVIVMGMDEEKVKRLSSQIKAKQNLYPLSRISHAELAQVIATLSKQIKEMAEPEIIFDSQSPLSPAQVVFHAKLIHMHPLSCEIAISVPSKQFALCQVSSPLIERWLKKPLWIKITQIKSHSDVIDLAHTFSAEAMWVDVTRGDIDNLARYLISYLRTVLGKFLEKKPPPPATKTLVELIDEKKAVPYLEPEPSPKAEDLAEEIANYRKNLAQKKQKESQQESKFFDSLVVRYFAFLFIMSLVLIIFINNFVPMLANSIGKSGHVFVEQLLLYSHHVHPEDESHKIND